MKVFKKIGGRKGHEDAGLTPVGRETGAGGPRKDVSPLQLARLLHPCRLCSLCVGVCFYPGAQSRVVHLASADGRVDVSKAWVDEGGYGREYRQS